MAQNPLAALLRSQNLTSWYLGDWNDRWSVASTIRRRALPEALGIAWYVAFYGLARVGPHRGRAGKRFYAICIKGGLRGARVS